MMTTKATTKTIAGVVVLAAIGLAPSMTMRAAGAVATSRPGGNGDPDLTRFVNPFIGTGNGAPAYGLNNAAGDTPPGAATPFGMVLWSPDTTTSAGGYRYHQNSTNGIYGFSLTHFSGRGVSCYQDVPVMPVVGPLAVSPGDARTAYAATFSHENESASPGFYSVVLDTGIEVDLTATARTGFGRFTFPVSDEESATVLIPAGGSAQKNDPNGASGTAVAIAESGREVTGAAVSGNCGGTFTYTLYFAARFDRPFADFGTWSGSDLAPGSTSSIGPKSGAYLVFDTASDPTVRMKVGLSFVSVDNARLNLDAEDPDWDFDGVAAAADAAWNARLNGIQVDGGSDDEKTVFYTALYHALIHPSVFSDTNGEYLGFDNQVHQVDGVTQLAQYHNYAGWDGHRSEFALLAILAPEANDMMQSLVNDAQQDLDRDPNGGGLPRWQHANANSGGMVGDSPDIILATAYAFGVTGFDAQGSLAAMDRGASAPGVRSGGHTVRERLDDYLNLGYVSTAIGGSAARTLEYVNDDFAISQLARALGRDDLHDLYLARAQNWRNLLAPDPASGDLYIVPRNGDGSFIDSFKPENMSGFVESSGAQYVWMVPFNLRGLFDAMGGNEAAVRRLDAHFKDPVTGEWELNAGPHSEFAFFGNEPELRSPWSYDFAGAPWKTQDVVREIVLELYSSDPGGLPGNDDGGAMGSFVVFSCLGLFPEIPGVGGFVVGSPLFKSATVRLASGSILQINAPDASDGNRFVQSLALNGTDYNSPWIPWNAVSEGGELHFRLDSKPNVEWGSDPSAAPPSFDMSSLTIW